MEQEKLIYTVKEITKLLHTSPNIIYELIDRGNLKAIKLGSLKIRKESLNNFLKENEGMDLSNLDDIVPLRNVWVS